MGQAIAGTATADSVRVLSRGRASDDTVMTTVPAGVATCDMIDRLGGLAERVGAVDDRRDLPGFDQVLQGDQVVVVLRLDGWARLLAHDHRDEHGPHGAAQLAVRVPAAVRDQGPARGQRAPRPGHRVVADVVEDQVVALGAPR